MHFEEVKQQEQSYLMPTYGRFQTALVSGKGATAVDTEGRSYIDFGAGIGVNALGYCDSDWVEAVSGQAATLQHISNLYYSPVMTQLAEALCQWTGLSKIFFGNSGAEANECAIKLARKYGTQTHGKDCNRIVTLHHSFHGRTVTTLSATGQDGFHHYFTPFTEGFSYADPNMESIKAHVDENTCGVMIELIQGEGGVRPLEKAFVQELAAFCQERDVLLLVDEVQTGVGRTGKLTPLARLAPVELAGATISRATLNNYDDILRKRVGAGSKVFIRRSNDVIPEILGRVDDGAPIAEVERPSVCPACGAHVEQRGANIFCTNSLTCTPQIVARLVHYASRDAMDIETFSDKTASQFVESLNIVTIPQLYRLTIDELLSLNKFKQKKAQNLLSAIERSKRRPLSSFLFALGIPNVGIKTARILSKRFLTLKAVRRAGYDELIAIKDIGDIVARGIVDFFSDESISSAIDEILSYGVKPEDEESGEIQSSIAGKTIVVTGTMKRMDRSGIEALIESLGASASGSVSKKTDYVVAGESARSKLNKANELGITVISEDKFFEMIGKQG